MAAAQTKGHEEDKHTVMQENGEERKEKRKTNSKKQGTKASKRENRTQGVSIATNLPVSATNPRRGHCHTISDPFPALVGDGIIVSLLPLSSLPPREQINENQTKLPGLRGCSNSGSTY